MTVWLWWAAVVTAVVAGARGTWSPCGLSMVSAINPFSESSRGNRYWATCLWFVAGSLAGGLVLGSVAAVAALAAAPVTTSVPTAAAATGALVAVGCLASDALGGRFSLPVNPRQVNETWLGTYRRWVYAAGFGAQIGAGFTTYVMTAATYLMVVLAVLTGSPGAALAVGVVFGVVRGGAVTLTAGARTPAALRGLHSHLDRWGPASLGLAMAAQAGVALALGWAAAGTTGLVAGLVLVASVATVTARRRAASGQREGGPARVLT